MYFVLVHDLHYETGRLSLHANSHVCVCARMRVCVKMGMYVLVCMHVSCLPILYVYKSKEKNANILAKSIF